VLERGFAIVVDSEGRLVRSVAAVGPGSSLKVAVADGVLETKVAERAAGDPFEQLASDTGDARER
jgi:exonuclease VII large subunit